MIKELEQISQVVHEAVRAWSQVHGSDDIPTWDAAPDWMKRSTYESVEYVLAHPEAGPGAQHDQWIQQRLAAGWTHGIKRDDLQKRHPMLIPFEQLPEFEKQKDALVIAIVKALMNSD